MPKSSWTYENSSRQAHIDLYVNEFSRDLGTKGKQVIRILLQKGAERGILPEVAEDIFVE